MSNVPQRLVKITNIIIYINFNESLLSLSLFLLLFSQLLLYYFFFLPVSPISARFTASYLLHKPSCFLQKLSIMSLRGVHPFLHRTMRLHISVFKKFGFSMHPLNPSLPLSHQAPFSRVHATHGFDHFLWSPKSTLDSSFFPLAAFEDAFEDAAASTAFKEEEDAKKKTKKKRKRAVLKAEEENRLIA